MPYNSIEISEEIIHEQIKEMNERYKKLERLFSRGTIKKCEPISDTIENFNEIRPKNKKTYPDLKSHYPQLKNCHDKTIYIISVTNFPYSLSEIKEIFDKIKSKFKENNSKISLCRINKKSTGWVNIQSGKDICLYVGSSENIAQRLKEHLFLYNSSTYAMHLAEWFKENDIKITINTWDFKEFLSIEDEEESSDYLQIIEDFLWNQYKPLFGRQGKK